VTGVRVRETVPDSVLANAHEIKLVDLPPDDLLERLRDGKVYVPAQAQRAIENFFKKGNLIALRELALRHTAERVDAQMREYRQAQGIEQTWAVTEQLLVAVSPSPYSARLIRAARRMAASLHARWFAVYVERPSATKLPKAMEAQLAQNLRLAEQLGAEVVTLSGNSATDEILRFAHERNITKLIVGKPVGGGLTDRFRASLVDQIVRKSRDIDVYVTAGDADEEQKPQPVVERESLHVPSIVAARRRHDLPARHHAGLEPLPDGGVRAGRILERGGVRLLLRATVPHVRGRRFSPRYDLHRHVRGGDRDQRPHAAHSQRGRGRS